MQTGLHLDGTASPVEAESIREVGEQVVKIIQASYEARLEQSVISEALSAFRTGVVPAPGIHNVTVSGCSIVGDTTHYEDPYEDIVQDEDEEDEEDLNDEL